MQYSGGSIVRFHHFTLAAYSTQSTLYNCTKLTVLVDVYDELWDLAQKNLI